MDFSKKIPTRLLQLFVLFILVVMFLWKAYEAWHKYSKGDKMIVTKVKHPKNQTFPSVTLCKGVIMSMYKGNISDLVEHNSQLENWLLAQFNDKNATQVNRDWEARKMARFMKIDSRYITCFTFNPPNQTPSGMQHRLDLRLKSNMSDAVYIIFHDSLNNIPIFGDVFEANVLAIPPISKESYFHMHLAVSTENTVHLSTKEEPCHGDSHNKTLCDCVEDNFQQVEGCVLPWHISKITTDINNACNDTLLKKYQEYMTELINEASFGDVYRITGCIPKCKRATYSLKKSLEMTLPINRLFPMYVGIFLAPTGVTEKQEVLIFDALELIGNVGGYLGLLLGWSAMSLVDWYFKRSCQK